MFWLKGPWQMSNLSVAIGLQIYEFFFFLKNMLKKVVVKLTGQQMRRPDSRN
jgi:hypothetical protein